MILNIGEKAIRLNGSLILQVVEKDGMWGNKCVYSDGSTAWTKGETKTMPQRTAQLFDEEYFRKLSFETYYEALCK